MGKSGIAVSLAWSRDPDFQGAASLAAQLIEQLTNGLVKAGEAVNVNIPALPSSQLKGVCFVRQDTAAYLEDFEVEPAAGGCLVRVRADLDTNGSGPGTDLRALEAGYVTVTPVGFDLTNEPMLSRISEGRLRLLGG